MNRSNFTQLLDETHGKIRELNAKKGHDYAGDDDALSNFKKAADEVGVDPLVIWFVYYHKHASAITTYIKDGGQLKSEPIEGRILDAILYLYLLLGLVREKEGPDA